MADIELIVMFCKDNISCQVLTDNNCPKEWFLTFTTISFWNQNYLLHEVSKGRFYNPRHIDCSPARLLIDALFEARKHVCEWLCAGTP